MDHCDLISIGPVSDIFDSNKLLIDGVKKRIQKYGRVQVQPFGVFTHFELPDTYDAYMKSLSKNERKNRRKYDLRLLSKEYDIKRKIIRLPHEIEGEMNNFLALHAEQWRQQGRLGYFGAWPKADAFNSQLAVNLAQSGRTHLLKISAGGRPIIYQYSFIYGKCCYWQLPARAVGIEWNRFSLGATSLVVLIRNMIENGIRRIEGGQSHYDYKTRLGAKESGISVIRINSTKPQSIAKYHMLIGLHRLYLNFYYKLWYSRIQHRLPNVFRRPIWMAYIRTSF
jgi:hypothetical protein